MKAITARPDTLIRAICLVSLLVLAACGSDDDDSSSPDDGTDEPGEMMPGEEESGDAGTPPDGLRLLSAGGARSVEEAIGEVEAAIAGNEAAAVVRIVDHAAGAASVGETLPPTQVILFGNPALGTPLMQASRTAGLDLPQKILAYRNADDELDVAWNGSDWLAARHGIDPATPELATIAGALEGLATRAADVPSDGAGDTEASPTVAAGDGIVTVTSENDFETTYAALLGAIQGAEPLNLVVELDHSMNAASAGLELPPTRLVVFGNPALGTPLMQSARSVAIDLPQRMLVWEADDGTVSIAYNDPAWVAERHAITDRNEQVETISGALAGLAAGAAGAGE